jgi:hypothetical protein
MIRSAKLPLQTATLCCWHMLHIASPVLLARCRTQIYHWHHRKNGMLGCCMLIMMMMMMKMLLKNPRDKDY